MEKLTKLISDYIIVPIPGFEKLNDYLFKPLLAGILGFIIFFIVITLIHFLSYITGLNEKFGMDYLDFLLAGFGFLLQMTDSLIKSFSK
jgi:hypothetical protein